MCIRMAVLVTEERELSMIKQSSYIILIQNKINIIYYTFCSKQENMLKVNKCMNY